jgi:hypothetical protein
VDGGGSDYGLGGKGFTACLFQKFLRRFSLYEIGFGLRFLVSFSIVLFSLPC